MLTPEDITILKGLIYASERIETMPYDVAQYDLKLKQEFDRYIALTHEPKPKQNH